MLLNPKEEEKLDPRVKRTRSLILRAFESLLAEKGFETISVQDGGKPKPRVLSRDEIVEMLASLTGAPRGLMIMLSGRLRVALATIHLPLRAVPPRRIVPR